MSGVHIPVLLNEVLEGLSIHEDGTYVDLTLGRAGHSLEILKRLTSGKLIGFDQDPTALQESEEKLHSLGKTNYLLIDSNFSHVKEKLAEHGVTSVDGILMDLGVSSPQFDEGERGFSYRMDARLDMRMDPRQARSAYDIVNECDQRELCRIFREYGEEKYAYQIASAIVRKRQIAPIETTFQLVDIIKSVLPEKEKRKKGHPAKQVFQALRIATNRELDVLCEALRQATELLNPKGRLAVITFQSLEDRIVKQYFRSLTTIEGTRHGPISMDIPISFRLVNRKVIEPTEKEKEQNPRSSSAKLRIIEKL